MQAVFGEGSAQSGSAQSYIRPLRCGASCWPRPYGDAGSGPNRPGELDASLVAYNWLPRPRLEDRLHPSCGLPTFLPAPSTRPPLRRGAPAPCSLPCSASAPRDARHLVRQRATSILGLRASIRASHEPRGAPRRTASNHRHRARDQQTPHVRWPIFDIRPDGVCPPSSAAGGPDPARPRSPGHAGSSPSAARRPGSPTP